MTTSATDALLSPSLRHTLTALRHDLHRHPELGFHETRTADALYTALASLQLASVERVADTGVVARIAGRDRHRPLVAIRGDIDALPIHEETGVDFASVHEGVMHACGHDVHAAWTVGAAHLLSHEPAAGDVLIVLQPAEETGRGAETMIEAGALDGVQAIFGAHVDTTLEVGAVVAQAGPLAASTDAFEIVVRGRGAHAARPHEGADPIVAAAAVVTTLQTIVSRRLRPGTPAVVTVGTFHAGTAANVIPDTARLAGTLRALDAATRQALADWTRRVAQHVATSHNVEVDVTVLPGTPPLVNDRDAAEWARRAVVQVLGEQAAVPLPATNLAGEDFACYLERARGCFMRIGARLAGHEVVPTHTSRFLPADEAVFVGAAVLAAAARTASADLTM